MDPSDAAGGQQGLNWTVNQSKLCQLCKGLEREVKSILNFVKFDKNKTMIYKAGKT